MSDSTVLLPASPSPRHYQLKIDVDLVAFCFRGVADIALEFAAGQSKITLHAVDLAFDLGSILWTPADGSQTAKVARLTIEVKAQTVTLDFGENVGCRAAGHACLSRFRL